MDNTKHLSFASIEDHGWFHTDTITYIIPPLNSTENLGLSLLLHTEGYGYENISVGITITQDTTLLYQEQRSYLLNHCTPKEGIGHRCDYTLPVGNITFCDTLPCTITLIQQLDELLLTGVREIGIHISTPIRQPGQPIWRVDWH